MRAVRLHGIGDLRVEDVDAPQLQADDEVLVAVEAAGICGSDLHNYRTGMWLTRVPSIPGHEFCGRIVATGRNVRHLAVGDRVIADSRVFCGKCDMCAANRANLCRAIGYVGEVIDGGFASSVRLRESQVLRLVDQSLDPAIAAMAEPLAVALHAVARLAPPADEPILVTGAGPIGALVALVLRHRGFSSVAIADRNWGRLESTAEVTGARPVELDEFGKQHGNQCRFVVETTGSAHVLGHLLSRMDVAGRIAAVGIFHARGELDLNRIVEGEVELVGCAAFKDELPQANALLAALAPALSRLASPAIGIDDVPAAYASLVQGKLSTIKCIIAPSG